MTPEKVSARLREIADRIDRSEHPSLMKVAGDIRTVLALILDAALPARNGPGGRRITPAQSAPVDVSDDAQFKKAVGRTASTQTYDR